MNDDLDGLHELHALVSLDGHPVFVSLIDEDVERAHGEANIDNGFRLLAETFTIEPSVESDRTLVAAILAAEHAAGVYWPVAA